MIDNQKARQKCYVPVYMSSVILCISSEGTKLKYREIEKVALKICLLNSLLSLNETCLNNKLLPTFTITHIYISLSCPL